MDKEGQLPPAVSDIISPNSHSENANLETVGVNGASSLLNFLSH